MNKRCIACVVIVALIILSSLALNLTLLQIYHFKPEPHECLATEDGITITQGPFFPDFTTNVGDVDQKSILLVSANPNCDGTELYDVSIHTGLEDGWPPIMLIEDGSQIQISPTELEQVGIYTILIKACLKANPDICSIGSPQTITITNPCMEENLEGPNFLDFTSLIGNPNQSGITIVSDYKVCEGLEKYTINIA